VTLFAKKEHHVTVFGFAAGKAIAKAVEAAPGLDRSINELAASFDWGIVPGRRFYHLERLEKGGGTLQTVIVMASARIEAFYAEVKNLLPPQPASRDLEGVLGAPPPPHVTLYTTDPKGLAGIGLNSVRDLEEATVRGRDGDASGLAAYLLGPGVVPAPAVVS
jgi:hypothetical protein